MKKRFKSLMAIGTVACLSAQMAMLPSCNDDLPAESYYTFTGELMSDFLKTKEDFSLFSRIVERAGWMDLLSSRGSRTLFPPTNAGVEAFLKQYGYASVEDIPVSYCDTLVRAAMIENAIVYTYNLAETTQEKNGLDLPLVLQTNGDTVDAELENRFDARMREAGTDCVLSPGYGLTETGSVCVLSPEKAGGAVLGKPLVNMRCRIVDEEGKDVPAGETGELLLAGNQLMTGYLDDEAATSAAFVEEDGVRWLKTGDMFRALPDGSLYFMGRKKRLIKISGVNVFPAEIERTAVELPFVGQCAAIEVREHNKPFIALFVASQLSDEQIKELKRHIVHELSKWHEPKYVICVDALPRTQVGKTDHVRLSDEFEKYRKKSS